MHDASANVAKENTAFLPVIANGRDIIIMNQEELAALLPHKGNALVLDSIIICPSKGTASGSLELSNSRKYLFEGHEWAMPGHWLSEFANITAACLVAKLYGIEFDKRRGVLATHNCSDFLSPVRLGDWITCEATMIECDGRRALLQATIKNQNEVVVAKIDSIRGAILGAKKQ